MKALIPIEVIEQRILLIRGQIVMLSTHLADLYNVETRVLNQAVKRNISRFPEDFMFQLNSAEAERLVSQNVIPHKKYFGGTLPYACTEQGVAMLSRKRLEGQISTFNKFSCPGPRSRNLQISLRIRGFR